MGKLIEEDKNYWLFKWDYSRYQIKDLVDEKKKKSFGINYGRYVKTEDRNKLLKDSYSSISENDDVFIMFTDIPGSSNQILLKASNLKFRDSNKNYFIYDHPKEKNNLSEDKDKLSKKKKVTHAGESQRYFMAEEIKWVLNPNNRFQFSTEGLNEIYNTCGNSSIKDRCSLQRITDRRLIDDLNSNLHSYSEYIDEMSKMTDCFFEDKIDCHNHVLFNTPKNIPYIEEHHFILQSVYNNYVKINGKSDELYRIIYSTSNIVLLCPRCHRKIHQGVEEEVNEMIRLILNDKDNKELKESVRSVSEILGYSDYKELINMMYNIDYKESD